MSRHLLLSCLKRFKTRFVTSKTLAAGARVLNNYIKRSLWCLKYNLASVAFCRFKQLFFDFFVKTIFLLSSPHRVYNPP